jgi:HPt (histidine-containing phosphotransfer) domain-containing protein
VINLFFKGAATLLKDLEQGATNRDATLLHQASHALKSASANVGAITLSSRCKELEAMAQSGVVSDAALMVRTILEDYRTAETLLSNRLQKVA